MQTLENAIGSGAALSTQPAMLDVADLLVAYLEQMGVEFVFGIPGGAIEPLYNALARSERRGGIRHVLARHEAGAAFMADGYARETGKLGVCCSTSGPGATNLITGVACAFDNSVPMLVLTGQPALPTFGKHPLQESACTGINTVGMFEHCTRYSSLVSHPDQFEAKLVAALQRATRPPYGPSHLSVPVDVFRSKTPLTSPSYDLRSLLQPTYLVDDGSIEALHTMLGAARKIAIIIGGACGEAAGTILQYASMVEAIVVTTPDGKGLVNPRHPRFMGVFGFGGHQSAETALRDGAVDLIVAVGASMGEWNSGGWNNSVLNDRLVHVDESEENLARTPMARMHVRGHILAIFKRLVNHLDAFQRNRSQAVESGDWCPEALVALPQSFCSESTPIKPQRLMRELGRMMPPGTRFLADTGNSTAWAVHYLHPNLDRRLGERRLDIATRKNFPGRRRSDGGWLRVTMNFAPMGWAIGGAIGTSIGAPEQAVVCITGDGSLLMNGQELSVAVAEHLPVLFVVLNDRALGMVKHGQRLAQAEQLGCDLPVTDFAMLARSLGAAAFTIRSPADLEQLDVPAIFAQPGPTLLDVHIDADEVPPMSVRMRVLAESL